MFLQFTHRVVDTYHVHTFSKYLVNIRLNIILTFRVSSVLEAVKLHIIILDIVVLFVFVFLKIHFI